MSNSPIPFVWEGDCFKPVAPRFQRLCDERFVVGEQYPLTVFHQRTSQSHNHYFACIKDAWDNLPEKYLLECPSPEHLRKRALVRTGYATCMTVVCENKEAARKFTIECRKQEVFAVVDVEDNVVSMWTPESQSYKAMGKERFNKSKSDVLDWIAKVIGADPADLGKAA